MVKVRAGSEQAHSQCGRARVGTETADQPNFALWGDTLKRMRTPADDGADQQSNRPRGRAAASASGARARSGPAGSSTAGSSTTSGSSVFAPDYNGDRRGADRGPGSGAGSPDASAWYGSTAGGAVGKGPVRGYPPVPGQPPPMYPPGQFAAWNRGRHGQARPAAPPGQPDGALPANGQSRPGIAQPGRDARQQGAWQQGPSRAPTAGGAWPEADGTSRYYERADSAEGEPGYSMLAVSDPAADVTSTQTWQALGEGRATGVWTAPARSAPGPPRPTVPPARRGPDVAGPDVAGHDVGLDGPDSGPTAPDVIAAASAALARTQTIGTGSTRTDGTGARARGRSGAHSGPQEATRTERGPQALQPTASPRSTGSRRSQRAGGRNARRKHPASVKLAITVAMLLVLAAAATLAYGVLRSPAKPKAAAGPTSSPKVTPSTAASPTAGPYGDIATRSSDPQPLTVAQLFPASFSLAGQPVTRTATAAGQRCIAALDGANIRSAVRKTHCDQVIRATYLATSQGLMGTIGVLNLSTAGGAVKAIRSADAGDFISQLKAKRGPTRKIGDGTGIEVAAAKGHYLILIWAEFTSLHKPKTPKQRTTIENFMTQLLDSTANVSLANRMLTGKP